MATCSNGAVLQSKLQNGTHISFCGLPFDERQTCGFLQREESIGVQLCCALTEAIGSSEAICQYTIGERIGQLIEILASFATAIAVGGLLIYAANRKLRARWLQRKRRNQGHQVIDAVDSRLFMNLLVAEFIQALGNFFTIKWIAKGFIISGDPVCTAQAAIKQIGIVGSALTSFAICIQTFYALVLRWPIKKAHSRWMIIVIWLWVVLDIMIPNLVHRNAPTRYYGSTGFWCWIDPEYKTEQIVTEYLYMWIALGFMLILYVAMAVIVAGGAHDDTRGTDTDSIRHSYPSYQDSVKDDGDDESKAVARMLLLYPLVYGLSVVPMSITRWMQFNGHEIPYQATLFTTTIFSIAGLFNVILFYFTRPEMVKGTNREMPPALPDTLNFTHTASPVAQSFSAKDLSSPHSPPIRLRNIPSAPSERSRDSEDYGLPPL